MTVVGAKGDFNHSQKSAQAMMQIILRESGSFQLCAAIGTEAGCFLLTNKN